MSEASEQLLILNKKLLCFAEGSRDYQLQEYQLQKNINYSLINYLKKYNHLFEKKT